MYLRSYTYNTHYFPDMCNTFYREEWCLICMSHPVLIMGYHWSGSSGSGPHPQFISVYQKDDVRNIEQINLWPYRLGIFGCLVLMHRYIRGTVSGECEHIRFRHVVVTTFIIVGQVLNWPPYRRKTISVQDRKDKGNTNISQVTVLIRPWISAKSLR